MTLCVRCSCTDDRACHGGCYWTRLSTEPKHHNSRLYVAGEIGICSACEDDKPIEGFDYVDEIELADTDDGITPSAKEVS